MESFKTLAFVMFLFFSLILAFVFWGLRQIPQLNMYPPVLNAKFRLFGSDFYTDPKVGEKAYFNTAKQLLLDNVAEEQLSTCGLSKDALKYVNMPAVQSIDVFKDKDGKNVGARYYPDINKVIYRADSQELLVHEYMHYFNHIAKYPQNCADEFSAYLLYGAYKKDEEIKKLRRRIGQLERLGR